MNLEEATIQMLQENTEIDNVDTSVVCKELSKIKNIVKAEYVDYDDNNEYKGSYILYLSKYLKRLATQNSVGIHGLSDRIDAMNDIWDVMNRYYDKSDYRIENYDDYIGYWYVAIRK